MELLTSTSMIVFLTVMILFLTGLIVYLNVSFYKEKRVFKNRIENLQHLIAEITKKQAGQSLQIQLSDEMDQALKSAKNTLSHNILDLNYEMFDLLSKNNLLKK